MDLLHEYSLAVAVALPVLAIVGINVFLAFTGERATLLLPGLASYPSIDVANSAQAAQAARRTIEVATERDAPLAQAANDMLEREAA